MSNRLPAGWEQRHIEAYEGFDERLEEGIERGKTQAVQQVTNIINDAIDDTIATSPMERILTELKHKIQQEVE